MAIKKFKVMASNAKKKAKSDGSCIPKSMRKDVKSGCTKKSVKASDTAKKFRVDIYKKDNPDALVKREVKTFNSEDEAKKYGESIANGGIVNVIEVKASRTKKSVNSGRILTPWEVEGEFADGYRYTAKGNSEAECVEKLADMQDKHGELVWYSGTTDEYYDAGRLIDSACTKKSVKSSIKATTELNDFYNVIYDMDGTWENPTTGWVGKCEIYQRDLDDGSYLFSLVFGDNESEPDEILFVPSEDKFTIYPNSGMPRFANSLSEFKRELKQEYSYLRKVSDSVTSAEKSVKSSKSLTVPKSKRKSVKATVSSDYDADTRFGLAGDVLYRAGVANKPHGAALAYYMPNNYVLTFNHGHGEMQSADLIFTLWNPNAKDEFDYAGILYTDLDSASAGNDETEVYVSDKTVLPLGETKKFKNFRKALDWLMKQANKKSVESSKSVKKFGVKASATAKRIAKSRITSSDNYYDEDIIFYWNGKKQFEGSIFDLADTVEILCHDPKVMEVFQDYCNQFGDPFDFDGTPRDTATIFTKMVMFEAEEANDPSDFYVQYSDYRNPTGGFEIFYANDGIYSAKSIKCSDVNDYSKRKGLSRYAESAVLDAMGVLGYKLWGPTNSKGKVEFYNPTFAPGTVTTFATWSEVEDFLDDIVKNGLNDRAYSYEEQDYMPDLIESILNGKSDSTFWGERQQYENYIDESKDVKAGITVGEDSRFDFSNPIYELDDYVKAIADGVIDRIQGITYDISKETIAFFDADNNVVFVQPIGGIIPEPDDLETDIYELSSAIKSEMDGAYGRENWEQDNDDPDHASRAVELSEDIGEVDIDDLEPITGEGEDTDYGFGFDSNGDPIDESTVEELERIAQEVLDKSEIHNIDEYADLHNFNYYASIPYIQESFDISFTYVADIYELSKNGMATDEGYYTTVAPYNIHFNVRCKNGEVEYAECTDVDVNDGYVKDVELKNFNLDALVQFATDLVNPVAMDIYNATTNL